MTEQKTPRKTNSIRKDAENGAEASVYDAAMTVSFLPQDPSIKSLLNRTDRQPCANPWVVKVLMDTAVLPRGATPCQS